MSHTPEHIDPGDWLDQQLRDLPIGGTSAVSQPGLGGLGTFDPSDPPVYLGRTGTASAPNPLAGKLMPDGTRLPATTPSPIEDLRPMSDVLMDLYRWSPAERAKFAAELEKRGLLEPGNWNIEDLESVWARMVDGAAKAYAVGKKITPRQFLPLLQTQLGAVGPEPFDPVQRSSGTSTDTSTSTSVNLTTKSDARVLLSDAFQRELGRDPSRKELRAFYSALRNAEKKNPSRSQGTQTTTSTSVTRTKGPKAGKRAGDSHSESSNSSTSSSVNSGGVTPSNFAQNYVDDEFDAEMDSRRTATDYYAALLGLAGA